MDFSIDETLPGVHCEVRVETVGRTGVEMEALTAVQVGLLTVYDMCKAVDRGMTITNVKVLEKHGGKSGDWVAARRLQRHRSAHSSNAMIDCDAQSLADRRPIASTDGVP